MIPVAVTGIVLQFMPDVIPMHHDLAGNTDRWGSKMESFIFPIAILFITLFWHILICVFEKKSVKANPEKEQLEAKSAAKVLSVVGISQAVMFGIMHYLCRIVDNYYYCFCKRNHQYNSYAGIYNIGKCDSSDIFEKRI